MSKTTLERGRMRHVSCSDGWGGRPAARARQLRAGCPHASAVQGGARVRGRRGPRPALCARTALLHRGDVPSVLHQGMHHQVVNQQEAVATRTCPPTDTPSMSCPHRCRGPVLGPDPVMLSVMSSWTSLLNSAVLSATWLRRREWSAVGQPPPPQINRHAPSRHAAAGTRTVPDPPPLTLSSALDRVCSILSPRLPRSGL
jgi:hypothetical protein